MFEFLRSVVNRIDIVGYRKLQFTEAPHVLRGMGLAHLAKSDDADTAALTAQANDFEAALGSERRYRPDAHTTVAAEFRGDFTDLRPRLRRQLAEALAAETPRTP